MDTIAGYDAWKTRSAEDDLLENASPGERRAMNAVDNGYFCKKNRNHFWRPETKAHIRDNFTDECALCWVFRVEGKEPEPPPGPDGIYTCPVVKCEWSQNSFAALVDHCYDEHASGVMSFSELADSYEPDTEGWDREHDLEDE